MEKEAKEVAEKMSDYAGAEKEALIKNTRNLSIIGACALGGYFLFKITGTITQRAEFETAYRYCEMLVFITTPLIPLYMTGLLGKMKRRKKNESFDRIPKRIRMVIYAIAAFASAAVIKILLSKIIGLL